MLNLHKTIVGIFIGFLLYGCGVYPCGKASSFIGLVSFSNSESDTIILRRFSKGTNFAALIREELHSGCGKSGYCINPITAYRLNGQFFSGDRRYDFIYLKK